MPKLLKSVRINPLQRRPLIFFKKKFYFVLKTCYFFSIRPSYIQNFFKSFPPIWYAFNKKNPFLICWLPTSFFFYIVLYRFKKKWNRITSSDGCWTHKSIRILYNSPCVFVLYTSFFSLAFIIRESAQQQIKSIYFNFVKVHISLCCVCV